MTPSIPCKLVKTIPHYTNDTLAIVSLPAVPSVGSKVSVFAAAGGQPTLYEVTEVGYETVDDKYTKNHSDLRPALVLAVKTITP